MDSHKNGTISVSDDEYKKISNLLYNDKGAIVDEVSEIRCNDCFSPIIITAEKSFIYSIVEILKEA